MRIVICVKRGTQRDLQDFHPQTFQDMFRQPSLIQFSPNFEETASQSPPNQSVLVILRYNLRWTSEKKKCFYALSTDSMPKLVLLQYTLGILSLLVLVEQLWVTYRLRSCKLLPSDYIKLSLYIKGCILRVVGQQASSVPVGLLWALFVHVTNSFVI